MMLSGSAAPFRLQSSLAAVIWEEQNERLRRAGRSSAVGRLPIVTTPVPERRAGRAHLERHEGEAALLPSTAATPPLSEASACKSIAQRQYENIRRVVLKECRLRQASRLTKAVHRARTNSAIASTNQTIVLAERSFKSNVEAVAALESDKCIGPSLVESRQMRPGIAGIGRPAVILGRPLLAQPQAS